MLPCLSKGLRMMLGHEETKKRVQRLPLLPTNVRETTFSPVLGLLLVPMVIKR
jgi:hypothetical protein